MRAPNPDLQNSMSSIVDSNSVVQCGAAPSARAWKRFVWLFVCAVSVMALRAQQPLNDNFTNATPIGGSSGTVNGTTVGATREAGEPAHWIFSAGTHSVWYTWVAPATGAAEFNTDGSPIFSDTLLAVYTGNNVGSLTLVAQDDDSGSTFLASRVFFTAIAGTAYRIAVDGYEGSSGDFLLNWLAQSNTVPVNTNEIQFASTNFIGSENQGFADVIVNYGGGAAGDVTVDFTTADGTALAGTN